jgi:hypothetical protein
MVLICHQCSGLWGKGGEEGTCWMCYRFLLFTSPHCLACNWSLLGTIGGKSNLSADQVSKTAQVAPVKLGRQEE